MAEICPLQITQQEFNLIRQCESVIVREYERADGSRFAVALAWGDAAEMQEQASTPSLQILPVGLSIVCQRTVLVSELLGQEE